MKAVTMSRSLKTVARQLVAIGCANGSAGRQMGCHEAADVIKSSSFLNKIQFPLKWEKTISEGFSEKGLAAIPGVSSMCEELASATFGVVSRGDELLVVGGDHSCAIGTWSGISSALRPMGDIGLIWIDAHLDAHTPNSSESGNIHGMPISHLLGYGDQRLCRIKDNTKKLNPASLVFIGIRSFEQPEKELMERLGVRIYYIEEVKRRGISKVLREAIEIANDGTVGFGLSIDLDGFSPEDAPALGTPEPDGIVAKEFLHAIEEQSILPLIATEIVEFLPRFDDANKTSERLVTDLINTIYLRKFNLQDSVGEKRSVA